MVKRDYYDVLGITKTATKDEMKRAYRRLAKKYHPDSNQNNPQAEQLFKEVTEAYNVLSDDEKRKLYDQFGHAAFDGSMGEHPGEERDSFFRQRTGNGEKTEFHFEGNVDDLFGDVFESMFHGRGFGGFDSFIEENKDAESELTVSFRDAALGCEKLLRLEGAGSDALSVRIPAGINEGQSIRLRGKGRIGRDGSRGDLLLKVHIMPDRCYTREGQNVYLTQNIPYTTAILGGEARFDTLYGPVCCKVPAGSQSGSKLRLAGKGIVSMQNKGSYGDEYVTLMVTVPKHVSAEERELLLRLKSLEERRSA